MPDQLDCPPGDTRRLPGTVRPIELIDGPDLLYRLAEHADIDAKIVAPADWKEPAADIPQEDS
jgi:hypothetical protein